jgi:hypothetical protein
MTVAHADMLAVGRLDPSITIHFLWSFAITAAHLLVDDGRSRDAILFGFKRVRIEFQLQRAQHAGQAVSASAIICAKR